MPRHIKSLDGLRAIAVLLVLWCHVPITLPGYPQWLRNAHWLIGPGNLGVELFFALSGFLITRILIAERERGQPVRWFLLRRLLRIFPIYYLLLAVMALLDPSPGHGWLALYLGNFADVFLPGSVPHALGHTWSLCVEEHFYLLWPLVVAWCAPHVSRRVLWMGLIPLAIGLSIAICAWTDPPFAQLALQRLSPIRFGTLAAGAMVAYAEPWLRAQPGRLIRAGWMLTTFGLLLHPHLWFVLVPFFWLKATSWPLELGPACLRVHSLVFATGLLIWCLAPAGQLLSPARTLAIAPLRLIGRISYGLYLYHLPIYHWILLPARPETAGAALGATAVAVSLTFAVATASYLLIERPILNYASRFRERAPDALSAERP